MVVTSRTRHTVGAIVIAASGGVLVAVMAVDED